MGRLPSHLLLTVAVLALATALRIWDPSPVAQLRQSVFDAYLNLKPRQADPALPVRIVDIDEASLAKAGQWPWPRTRLAGIVKRLAAAGARVIAVDLILAEPDRLSPAETVSQFSSDPVLKPLAERAATLPSNDQILGQAIAHAPVVLGFSAEARTAMRGFAEPKAAFAVAGDDPALFVPRFSGSVGSLPVLQSAAAGLGAVNWLPERDQVVRRVPLLVSAAGKLYPSLALETLRVATGASTILVKSSGGSGIPAFGQQTGIDSIRVGPVMLPADGRGELWINFAPHDSRMYIPAHTVLDGTFDASAVAGRIVLIGASATGLLDLRATPLAPSVPGVEIHAQALEQMLSGKHIVRPAWAVGAEILFLVTAGALVACLIRRSGAVVAASASAISIAAVSATSWAMYAHGGILFDAVYPSLSLAALYTSGSLYNYRKAEAERARIRSAFGYYVAPAVVEELALNTDRLKLGGEMREVTLLFADVRGFSKLSEGMDAEQLIRFVNTLFTPLTEVILTNRGTIDKFMGDAVMAFWNAPLADPAHAINACRSALSMQAEVERLDEARGQEGPAVRIGIGLNTGDCVVGNVGSPQRFDYSVLGDAVNVAARLEEMTKTLGAPIIAGERTAEAAAVLAFLEIGSTALRGKARPERLYALIGDETVAASAGFAALKAAHAALQAAIADNDRAGSRKALAACRAQNVAGAAPLLDRHAAVIDALEGTSTDNVY